MRTRILNHFMALAVPALLSTFNSQLSTARAQGTTSFTYQGQLRDNGTNANGAYTMIFKLYDAVTSGNEIGIGITNDTTLANGLFTVNLDFGVGAFNGSARWLDITVTNAGVTQTLSPRVQIFPVPYAQFAAIAATVTNGAIMNAQLAGGAVATTNIQNGAVINQNLATNAVATTNIQDGSITDSKIAAVTSLMVGSETNLRVVRGILTGVDGSIIAGSGFTAVFNPPGSGGYNVGIYNVYNQGTYYQLELASELNQPVQPGDYIVFEHEIFQAQSVDNPNDPVIITTTDLGCGDIPGMGEQAVVTANPRLATEWDITFTPPFSEPPSITTGLPGYNAYTIGSSKHVYLYTPGSPLATATNFQAIVDDIPYGGYSPPGCPPYGNGFEFIAVGPK